MRFILFFLLTLNLLAVDAELTIEKDVEAKASLSIIEDSATAGSSSRHETMFAVLRNDLKLSGHFNLDATPRRADFDDINDTSRTPR